MEYRVIAERTSWGRDHSDWTESYQEAAKLFRSKIARFTRVELWSRSIGMPSYTANMIELHRG